jgi:superfamily II DNA or RNA helicase
MTELRPYQNNSIKGLWEAAREHDRMILSLPTGGGKSTIMSAFVKIMVKHNRRVIFVVHSRELVIQFAQRMYKQFGVECGIIMNGVKEDRSKMVQCASVLSLINREYPPADVLIIDECHRCLSASYMKVIDHYDVAKVIGLTATPFRTDGKGMGDVYQTIIQPITIKQLISQGYLVPTKVYGSPHAVDMTDVDVKRGDYDQKQMWGKFNDYASFKSVVDNYKAHAEGKKAICFNVNVEHNNKMKAEFEKYGYRVAALDAKTKKKERERVVKGFANGEYDILNNVGLFIEGFDIPDTECVILNRATHSKALYVQAVGRGLRPAKDKDVCIVLDHGGNTERHGFVEDYDAFPFSLHETKKKKKSDKPINKTCPQCSTIVPLMLKECGCGFVWQTKEREITFKDGVKLRLLDRESTNLNRIKNIPYKQALKLPPQYFRIYGLLNGYKEAWAIHKAIEAGHVDIDIKDPDKWRVVPEKLKEYEKYYETYGLFLKLEARVKNGQNVQNIAG